MARKTKKTPMGQRPQKKRQQRPAETPMEEEPIGEAHDDYAAPQDKPENATWED